MKKILTTSDIAHELLQDGNANWSYNGAYALAEYFEQYEEKIGEEFELDVVAAHCDYTEYESLQDWAYDYFTDAVEEMGFAETEEINDEEFDEKIREYVQYHGQLIEFDGGVIVSQF
jgi:predicted hydrolase (HD superfamily)